MSARLRLSSAAVLLTCMFAPEAAFAAPKVATSTSTATILRQFTIVRRVDLSFGGWVPLTGGTVVVNPVTGAITKTGAVVPVGATGYPATFTTTGSRNTVVIVKAPNGSTTLTRVGGGGTMTVNNWTLDGPSNRRVPATQTFDFKIGATLTIGNAQPEGTYTGTFTVTVNHP